MTRDEILRRIDLLRQERRLLDNKPWGIPIAPIKARIDDEIRELEKKL